MSKPIQSTDGFFDAIKARRQELEKTQSDLSADTGIARPNIARLEDGKLSPRLDTILKVLDALDLELILKPKA